MSVKKVFQILSAENCAYGLPKWLVNMFETGTAVQFWSQFTNSTVAPPFTLSKQAIGLAGSLELFHRALQDFWTGLLECYPFVVTSESHSNLLSTVTAKLATMAIASHSRTWLVSNSNIWLAENWSERIMSWTRDLGVKVARFGGHRATSCLPSPVNHGCSIASFPQVGPPVASSKLKLFKKKKKDEWVFTLEPHRRNSCSQKEKKTKRCYLDILLHRPQLSGCAR